MFLSQYICYWKQFISKEHIKNMNEHLLFIPLKNFINKSSLWLLVVWKCMFGYSRIRSFYLKKINLIRRNSIHLLIWYFLQGITLSAHFLTLFTWFKIILRRNKRNYVWVNLIAVVLIPLSLQVFIAMNITCVVWKKRASKMFLKKLLKLVNKTCLHQRKKCFSQ